MTAAKPENGPQETVEDAMNQVLLAERRAEQAVETCKQDAMKIRQAAKQQAKRIAKRANERLSISHMRCNAKITRELKERERSAAARKSGESGHRLDEAALTAVVEALALDLTGITPSGSHSRDN